MLRRSLRRSLIPLALACGFIAAPFTGRPPSAWADTPDAAPAIVVDPNTGTVTPGPGTPADEISKDPVKQGGRMYKAISGGDWRLVAALGLAAIMVLGVKYAPRVFGKTDRGKAFAIMLLSMLGTTSAALADVVPMTPSMFIGAAGLAFTAVGGRQWLSRLLWPQDGGSEWLAWLKPWLGVKP